MDVMAKEPQCHHIPLAFPEGDALGVVLSFLSESDILCDQLFSVSKEWRRVLRELPHAWS